MTLEELHKSPSVKTWLEGLQTQSQARGADDAERLNALLAFVKHLGKDPDTIIKECLKDEGEHKKIKAKARTRYCGLIEKAEAEIFGGGNAGRQKANMIRSFFIHNGVFLQAKPLR